MATVALVQTAEARHRGGYLDAIRDLEEITDGVIVDASGATFAQAQQTITGKPVRTYHTFAEMLAGEKAPPAMVIATASGVEAPGLILPALDAGIPVLAEKPACVDADSFARLVDASERRDVPLMLALANRVAPWAQDAKRILQSGGIGKLLAARALTLADYGRIWDLRTRDWTFRRAEVGGGYLIWLGIHLLDMLVFLTGERIVEVQAQIGNVNGAPVDVEDLASMNVRFGNGAQANLLCGYVLDTTLKQIDVSLWGGSGWVRVDQVARKLEWHSPSKAMNEASDRVLSYNAPGGGYTPWVRDCLRASLGEIPPPITGPEGLHVLKAIFAAYESAETGRSVSVA
jgi:predicted dehydrogenase